MINPSSVHYEYPFTAIVGQELLKLALAVNAIVPCGMGVLIRGQKGTAKSTAVRALANLLPPIKRYASCPFNCDPDYPDHLLCASCRTKRSRGQTLATEVTSVPLVTLPLNATEDNLVGSIDFEHTIKSGVRDFLPGLLAKAHRGILYVDEVNLLDDHLVDLLLSASASGINIVEREGISCRHSSEFMLIGTMNPEEGELRPQFLDRFGLCIQIDSLADTDRRVEIMKRHHQFIDDPTTFCSHWHDAEQEERRHIQCALSLVKNMCMTKEKYSRITRICHDAQVAGHRADIIIERAARAIAAYRGHNEPEYQDINLAAALALPHRIRKMDGEPTDAESSLRTKMDEPADQIQVSKTMVNAPDSGREKADVKTETSQKRGKFSARIRESRANHEDDSQEPVGGFFRPHFRDDVEVAGIAIPIPVDISNIFRGRIKTKFGAPGRRYCAESTQKRGRYIRATICQQSNDIAFDATIRAAAPFQVSRPRVLTAMNIQPDDIRTKVREQKKNTLLVFVVDASGSIGYQLMRETKGAILYFLQDAYVKRDKVCLIAFRNDRAETLLPPTSSIDLAKKKLEDIPTGGKTPLCAGMLEGYNVIRSSLICNKGILPLLVLVTDGRANVSIDPGLSSQGKNTFLVYDELFSMAETIRSEKRLHSVIIDVETRVTGAFRMTEQIAEKMGAKYVALDAIKSGSIAHAVRSVIKLPEHDWRA
jgi:magnesium chelatase subunit D